MPTSVRGALGLMLTLLCAGVASGDPPTFVPIDRAIDQSHFVGIVKIAEVPPAKKEGFRSSAPPTVVAKPVAVFKGDEKAELRVVWQTYCRVCVLCDTDKIEVVPPAVGDEYMVFLTKSKDGTFSRLGYQWHFHKMPAAPTVRLHNVGDAWRSVSEVSPAVAGAGTGEAVRYRLTRTRLATDPWVGDNANVIAQDLAVVDFTRKLVVKAKKPGTRVIAREVVEKGRAVVDVIDITDAFGLTKPGAYWLFDGSFHETAALRFEISDQPRTRPDGGNR